MHRHTQKTFDCGTAALRAEVLEPVQPATASVIWLHGLGASGDDFVPVVPHLKLADDLSVRFIFPHAPEMPVTCNGGYIMPAWYDILALSEIRDVNVQDLQTGCDWINAIVCQQIAAGIAPERIVVMGFSQGGAVAYHTTLSFPQKLAGLIALSTYLPAPSLLTPQKRQANQTLPVRIAHGDFDDVVTERAGRLALQWLQEQGYDVQWKQYPMAHEVCISEIRQIGEWLTEMLNTGTGE
ncbi:MAG TPA: alpha/beta fold hydrolase [Dongiaceae bacterium]|nr:alpha/beta fold hydrolase [Dongiaceae bacterium]